MLKNKMFLTPVQLPKCFKSILYCFMWCLFVPVMVFTPIIKADVFQPSMVIIIDDLGYNLANGLGIVNLPGPITLAVMPHTPHGAVLARKGACRPEAWPRRPHFRHGGKPIQTSVTR